MKKHDELNKLWKVAQEKFQKEDRWRDFFVACGLRFDPSAFPDNDGWIEATGCIFTTGKIVVNLISAKWRDDATNVDGNIFEFINRTQRYPDNDNYPALRDICKFIGVEILDRPDPIGPDDAAAVSPEALAILTDKITKRQTDKLQTLTGINKATATRYRIGWMPGEFTIPIPDADGTIKAIRTIDENMNSKWLNRIPRANKLSKQQRLFGIDELQIQNWKNVIVTNSELDRMLIMQEKLSDEWGAVSVVDGYSAAWNPYFYGRNVVIIFSSDHFSISTAQRVVGPVIKNDVDTQDILSLKHVRLPGTGTPEDCKVYHWFKGGGTWDTLMKLERFQAAYEPPGRSSRNSDRKNLVSLIEIDDPDNNGLKVRVPLTVTGEYPEVYDSIDTFEVQSCKLIKSGECRKCESVTLTMDPTSPRHLASYEASDKQILRLCVEHCCDVPGNRPVIGNLTRSTYRKIIATQSFSSLVDRDRDDNGTIIDGKQQRLIEKHLIVRVPPGSPKPIEPRSYMATGAVHTSPVDSTRSMIIETLEPIPEEYETFNFKLHTTSLNQLRDIGWAGIVKDLIMYRTRMFDYDELMIMNLLVLCSPLRFNFNGETGLRGWIVACILGDTGVGKSKTYETLMKMTGIGSIFNSKNGGRTGLTHASVRMGGQGYKIQAGLLPLASRKILMIEETQEIELAALKSMSEAMYDGKLQVNFSARQSYETMTRVIMNCNCKYNKPMDNYALGCLSIKDLFDHTFIRRVDLAAFVRKFEEFGKYHVNHEVSGGEPAVTPEMLRHLIYFAWSLTADRIEFSRDVTNYIMEKSMEMIGLFGRPDDITLVYPSDFRFKLARISIAWAVLALSSTDGFKTIEVKREHVDLTVGLLKSLYSHPDCGLDKYSEQWVRAHAIDDYAMIVEDFKRNILMPHGSNVGEHSKFARFIGLLRSGVVARRNELARMLKFDFKWVEEQSNYLMDHNLARLELPDRLQTTSKFNRVMEKMEREDRAVFVQIRAASVTAEIEKEIQNGSGAPGQERPSA